MNIHSVHAEESAERKIKDIHVKLECVKTLLGKYESLQRFHYGHVGDLGHVQNLLVEAYEFLLKSDT